MRLLLVFFLITGLLGITNLSFSQSDCLAPQTHNRLLPTADEIGRLVQGIQTYLRRQLSTDDVEEIKKVMKWMKAVRQLSLNDTLLKPNASLHETQEHFKERIQGIVIGLKYDPDLPPHIRINWNDHIGGPNDFTFDISYKQASILCFTHIERFAIEGVPSGELLPEFAEQEVVITKELWQKPEERVKINAHALEDIALPEGVSIQGLYISPSKKYWINPWGYLDSHFFDSPQAPEPYLDGTFVVNSLLSERPHIKQSIPFNSLVYYQNLQTSPQMTPTLVIGDVHSDSEGIQTLLMPFLKPTQTSSGKSRTIDIHQPSTYEIAPERFPNGFHVVFVGDLIGRQKKNQGGYQTAKAVLALMKKTKKINNPRFQVSWIAGNYELASALFSENSAINHQNFYRIRGAYNHHIRPHLPDRQLLAQMNDWMLKLIQNGTIQAASLSGHDLVVHGGLTNILAKELIQKLLKDRKWISPDETPDDTTLRSFYEDHSRQLLLAEGKTLYPKKLYKEDLCEEINQLFLKLVDPFHPERAQLQKWFIGTFEVTSSGTFEDTNSILEARPSDFYKNKSDSEELWVSQITGHSPDRYFTAPITVEWNGKLKRVDTDFNQYAVKTALYVSKQGYCQVARGILNPDETDAYYASVLGLDLKPSPAVQKTPEKLSFTPETGPRISLSLEVTEQGGFVLNLDLEPVKMTRYTLGDISAILSSFGVGIESMKVFPHPQGDDQEKHLEIRGQSLRLETIHESSVANVQNNIFEALKKHFAEFADIQNRISAKSMQYFEIFQKGAMLNSGINQSYFPRSSQVQTEVTLRNLHSGKTLVDIRSAERTGLAHIIFRVLCEEENFVLHEASLDTEQKDGKKIAKDFFWVTHADGIPLKEMEMALLRKRLTELLDQDIIDGRVLGLPSKRFHIQTLSKQEDHLIRLSLNKVFRISS